MFLRSNLFRVFLVLTIILSVAVFAFADTIRLKDGSIIKGKIVSFENGQFMIVIGEGTRKRTLRFFADEIESVKFDSKSTPSTMITRQPSSVITKVPRKPSYRETKSGNDTIITVGSAPRTTNPRTTNPKTSSPPAKTTANNDSVDRTPVVTTPSNAKPIQIKAKVLADNTSNGWTNAGWVVRKGQRIRITANGRISLGNGRYSGPSGISTLPDSNKLIKDSPTGGLIAVIGDDNNEFIFIGNEIEFVAKRDGALFLGINEGRLSDNTGSFDVTVEIATTIGN